MSNVTRPKPLATRYRDIKVPEHIYQNARMLRDRAFQVGLNQIPTDISSPTRCPVCNGPLQGIQVGYQYVHCEGCGYNQQQLAAGGSGMLGLGVIIGLGLAALASYLSDSETPPRRKRYSRRRR